MISLVIIAAVVIASAILNRMRGDERWKPAWLKGRALFYVTPTLGAVALTMQPWPVALAFAAGYAFWAIWSWGYVLAAVGGVTPNRPPGSLDRFLLKLPGRILPVFVRMLFALPCAVAVAALTREPAFWLAGPTFAAAATAAYLLLFRPLGRLDWLRAEVVVGALWGVMIVGA